MDLDLGNNDIDDEGEKFLIELLNINKSLINLKLCINNITWKENDQVTELLKNNMINRCMIENERIEEKIYLSFYYKIHFAIEHWQFIEFFDQISINDYL